MTPSETTQTLDAALERLAVLEDERAVRATVARMGTAVDDRDWDACVALFTDPVRADWSQLSGQPAADVDPRQLVEAWRANLGGLEATHHLTAGHTVELRGDTATCACYVIASHRLANPHGGPVWTIGGRYDHELQRTPDGWRIGVARFTPMWATGNQHVMALAAEVGA